MLLAVDTQVGLRVQLVLGVVTWVVLIAAIWPLETIVRAQVIGVILFATVAEVTGSLIWGVYRYRLHNLPLFIPPAHGLVYLSGLALAAVVPDATGSSASRRWGSSDGGSQGSRCCRGSTSQARCACRCSPCSSGGRASARRTPACSSSSRRSSCTGRRSASGVGRPSFPASGLPQGNPPSGVASGYVWFDVMALLVAPWLVVWTRAVRARLAPAAGLSRIPARTAMGPAFNRHTG